MHPLSPNTKHYFYFYEILFIMYWIIIFYKQQQQPSYIFLDNLVKSKKTELLYTAFNLHKHEILPKLFALEQIIDWDQRLPVRLTQN